MQFPAHLLAEAVKRDATRPVLTYYDDTPGGTGERIEISRRVLGTWVAKAANALQEQLDVQPGSVVLVDLPSPHWRLAYWALAVWSVGATLTVDNHEGADVLITTEPDGPLSEDCDEVVAVALPGLAREFGTELRSGVLDEAAELATFADDFVAWEEPEPEDVALVHHGERLTYEQLLTAPESLPEGTRCLITTTDAGRLALLVLRLLEVDSSAVLIRGPRPAATDDRLRAEGVAHVVDDHLSPQPEGETPGG